MPHPVRIFFSNNMIWIRRVIRITTFLALGSSASTPSGPGHHKEVAFPRRAALLHSTILVLADHSQPSIQDIHCQGTRIVQNLHLTPSLGLIRSEAHKILDFFLDHKHSEDLILCASRDFDQGHGFATFDDIPDPFGSSAPFRSSLDSQTPKRDSNPFGSSGPFRTSLDSQTPRRESGHHSTVKLLEETQTRLGLLHLGHHSTVKLQEETRTHLGLQGLSGHQWRLREKTLIVGVDFNWVIVLLCFCVCYSPFQAFLLWVGRALCFML